MLDPLLRHAENLDRYTELRSHANLHTRLVMRKGVVIENTQAERRGVSARCYHGGPFGFASGVGDSDAAIEAVVAEASANAELARHGSARAGALPEAGAGRGEFDYRTGRTKATAADRMAVVAEIDDYVTRTYPGLLNADIVLSNLAIEKALVTSEGAATRSYVPRSNVMLQLAVQGNDGVVDLHQVYGGFGDFEERFDRVDWMFDAVDRLYEELREKADGTYCEAGTHDVILDSDLAGILAHEAIGHTCEADLVLGGSVAGDNLGRQVASEKFTLVDHAGRGPDGNASIAIHVDDEGTPCRDVTIIEDGVLKGFLHNKETARAFGVEPTGNARAYTFSDEPLVRMRNTAIKPGTDSLEDMIASIDRGYYLKRSSNGQADSTSEFMFGVTQGCEIRNGVLGRAIRDSTISGVAFDMLKTITHVSDDLTWSRGGMCGKKQLIPVGMGGPAIKCRINLGGR